MAEENKDVVGDIGARLGGEGQQEKIPEGEPKPIESIPFDMGKLTPDQLQQLKSMLAVTPERITQKKGNPITTVRQINGKYAVAIGKAYLALVYDAARLTEIETHKIPVKFYGEDKFTDVIYPDFMAAEKVKCEILSVSQKEKIREEGEIVKRETGKLVKMEVKMVNYFFKIKLPDGSIAEIEGSAANA